MTLPLHLPPELEQRLELVTLLHAWMAEGNSEEQREAGEYLARVLDEDRLADWKLVPSGIKGRDVVSYAVLLDVGLLGIATNPRRSRQSIACAH
jgi:hypothetical protein